MIKKLKRVHICFDFDGTLADSFEGIYWAFCKSAQKHTLAIPTKSELRQRIGPPIENLFDKIYGIEKEHLRESFRLYFRENYDQEGYKQTKWYEGAKEQIVKLRDGGATLSIVTNKPTKPTTELVKEKNLSEAFQFIIGIDYQDLSDGTQRFTSKKDALSLLKKLIAHEQHTNLIYVGDTPGDQQAAIANSFYFLACTYGYHDWQQEEIYGQMNLLENIGSLYSFCTAKIATHCQSSTIIFTKTTPIASQSAQNGDRQ